MLSFLLDQMNKVQSTLIRNVLLKETSSHFALFSFDMSFQKRKYM